MIDFNDTAALIDELGEALAAAVNEAQHGE